MLFEQRAGEDLRNRLFAVERHVEREGHAGHGRDLADVVVNGVALGDAPDGVRVADVTSVVQHERRGETGQTRGHHLRSAAEAGEEMRFDEAGRDADVGLGPVSVQPDGHAARRRAGKGQLRRVSGVVIDDPVARHDVGPEHPRQLVGRTGTVGARGDQNRDVLGARLPERGEDGFEHHPARLRACDVADRDRDLVTGRDERGQRRPGRRTLERACEGGGGVAERVGMTRRHDDGAIVGDVHHQAVAAVVEIETHGLL